MTSSPIKVLSITPQTNFNAGKHRKGNGFDREIAVLDPATGRAIVTARFYMPGSQVHCCVWINSGDVYTSGGAGTTGYGYHKASKALERALTDAGVVLSRHLGGTGESAMREAVLAVGRKVTGKRKLIVHEAHA